MEPSAASTSGERKLSSPINDKTSVSSALDSLLNDTTDQHAHHLFDSNCKVCTGKVPPPGETQSTGVTTTTSAIRYVKTTKIVSNG